MRIYLFKRKCKDRKKRHKDVKAQRRIGEEVQRKKKRRGGEGVRGRNNHSNILVPKRNFSFQYGSDMGVIVTPTAEEV